MPLGDCYHAAGTYIMDKCVFDEDAKKRFRLVHGRPFLTVEPYIQVGHAWVEDGTDQVYDAESGRHVPKHLYYLLGQIVPEECKVYTYEEMAKLVNDHLHWGPWELPSSAEEDELRERMQDGN